MYRVVFIFALFLYYTCIIRALLTYGLVIREKFRSSKKGFRSTVRSSRTSYSFRSLHSSCAQKNHLPQKVPNRVFTQSLHFAYSAAFIPVQNLLIPAPFRSFVHTLFAYTRKLARGHSASGTGSNASTVSPVAACICFAVALRFVGCLFPQAGIFIRVHFLPSANIVF